MEVKIKRLHSDAKIPRYATPGAACFDLHSVSGKRVVMPESPCTFATGLAVEVPKGHVMLIFSRSGHGFNQGTRLANCVGVIDSDYRGEIKVKLTADELANPLPVCQGDRIAQAMIIPVEQVTFVLSEELSSTERGTGGFGSTGV